MRNFKILIQYEGTKYQGWQRQESTGNTIQGKFEAILSKMTDSKVQIDGSGRTDAGVHAYGQVANFKIDTKMRLWTISTAICLRISESFRFRRCLRDFTAA